MSVETIDFQGDDGKAIHLSRWTPATAPKAAVQIAHGMGEHIGRYQPVAERLNEAGYVVYGNDHRGHGRTDPDRLGDLGAGGWEAVIADARCLNERIGEAHPGLPRILLGHSMGAMLAQQYVCRHGGTLDALVLSGSPGFTGWFASILPRLIARIETWRLGSDGDSALMANLLFGQANKAFDAEDASGFEWLSRDADEMRKYVDDPHCGAVLRAGSLSALFRGAREASSPAHIAGIPVSLPIHVISGTADPVHNEMKNLDRLFSRYQQAALTVTCRLYEDGRHELFNETNRRQVLDDLIDWLDGVL
ncbi:MAG: alpha/beta hydrolase [Gammaproteobacteria bacterium]|nr:alpha/beta hydrolase [Gammaproteobacteria bacterium]MYK81665.1 alpha/beta hydrolase [Gammaproteobacteria bacterium]